MSSNLGNCIRETTLFQKFPWKTLTPLTLDPHGLPLEIKRFLLAVQGAEVSESEHLKGVFFPSGSPRPGTSDGLTENVFPLRSFYTQERRSRIGLTSINYLLLDTVSWQNSGPRNEKGASVRRGILPFENHLPYAPLRHWSNVIIKAEEAFNIDAIDQKALGDGLSATYHHLINIYQNGRNIRTHKILSNIETASMHLRYLLEGNVDFPKDKALFIADLKRQNPDDTHSLIDKAMKTLSMPKLRYPLHAALTISPICLLTNISLIVHSVSEDKLCEVWVSLGGYRPEVIRNIEHKLWKILWNHATEGVNLRLTLKETLSSIVKDLAQSADRRALGWFNEKSEPISAGDVEDHQEKRINMEEEEEEEDDEEGGKGDGERKGDKVDTYREKSPSPRMLEDSRDANHRMDVSFSSHTGAGLIGSNDDMEMEKDDLGISEESQQSEKDKLGEKGEGVDDAEDERTRHLPENGDIGNQVTGTNEGNRSGDIPTLSDGQNNNSVGDKEGNTHQSNAKLASSNIIPEVRRSLRRPKKHNRSASPGNPRPLRAVKRTRKNRAKDQLSIAEARKRSASLKLDFIPPYHEVIIISDDEDEFDIPKLKEEERPQRGYASKQYHLFPVDGAEPDVHTGLFYRKEDADWFNSMMDATEKSYIGGKPPHLVGSPTSALRILTRSEFLHMKDKEVQVILSSQHIVVMGEDPGFKYDLYGLETLAPLDRTIVIHDHSIPIEDNYNVRQAAGTLIDMHNSASSPEGKILNSLDFPMPFANPPSQSITSDVKAWTKMLRTAKKSEQYPSTSTRWGLAATTGAYHAWHIDAEGFGTYVECMVGSKVWFIAKPKSTSVHNRFAERDMFIPADKEFQVESTNEDRWDIEAVYLTPGACLIMRPNTPHAVYTPEHSICHGGHFFATSTIKDTCYGMFHTFVATSTATNTEHVMDSRLLLRKMMAMYSDIIGVQIAHPKRIIYGNHFEHVPDIKSFEGILDVVSLHNIMELSHIINPKMYGSQAEVHNRERHAIISGRDISRNLVELIFSYYELVDDNGEPVDPMADFVWPYLAQQSKCLLAYKAEAINHEIYADNLDCTFGAVYVAMQYYLAGNPELLEAFNLCKKYESFAWTGKSWTVRQKENPSEPMEKDGYTYADDIWLGYEAPGSRPLPNLAPPNTTPNPSNRQGYEVKGPSDTIIRQESDESDSDSGEPLAKRRRTGSH